MTILEQFMGRDAGPLIQFIKYGLAGGVATGAHILVFHLAAWKLFPALQANDWFVKIFKLSMAEESTALRARNSMIDNGIAFMFSNMGEYCDRHLADGVVDQAVWHEYHLCLHRQPGVGASHQFRNA